MMPAITWSDIAVASKARTMKWRLGRFITGQLGKWRIAESLIELSLIKPNDSSIYEMWHAALSYSNINR